MTFFLAFELSVLFGFLLDLLLADPERMPHPVVIMGRGISYLEPRLRRLFPESSRGRRAAGGVMAGVLTAVTLAVTVSLCMAAWRIHPVAFFLLHTLWCWQAVAVRGLAKESEKVYRALTGDPQREGKGCASVHRGKKAEASEEENFSRTGAPETDDEGAPQQARLTEARQAVSRIVGRDTRELDEDGVTRAAVETVAENFSDGVVAPYFYMMLGGAPLALTYKAVNTMDSMVGYKNQTYIDFGRIPARLDDAAGFLPSRIGALLWILSAGMMGRSLDVRGDGNGDGNGGDDVDGCGGMRGAWRMWRRDRRNHASPNAAQTESACAGALGVQLAGPAWYFGERYEKPFIGDPLRAMEPEDILRTNRMMYGASVLVLLVCLTGSSLLLALTLGL